MDLVQPQPTDQDSQKEQTQPELTCTDQTSSVEPELCNYIVCLVYFCGKPSTNYTQAEMDYILGFVARADNAAGFTNEYIPVYHYTQFPAFEMVLGLGFVNTSIAHGKSMGGTSDQRTFYIGWRPREDQRINEILLQLYSFQSFAIDLAVVRIGEDGKIIPLSGYGDMLRAFLMVER